MQHLVSKKRTPTIPVTSPRSSGCRSPVCGPDAEAAVTQSCSGVRGVREDEDGHGQQLIEGPVLLQMMLQGPHAAGPDRPLLLRLSFRSCVVGTLCLPLLGLLSCVFISSVYHFEDATGTHCHVPNYLPSISASISLTPECHIWRACIGVHWGPRVLVEYSYFKFYRGRFGARSVERSLSALSLLFSVCENMGLLILTSVSSTEAFAVHKIGFLLFIGSSLVYMLITCRLWSTITKQSFSPEDARSYRWKKRLLLACSLFCGFAGFFYWKHNVQCQSGAYTLFALFEYLLVFSNMAFHLTAVWDFRGRDIAVVSLEDKHF